MHAQSHFLTLTYDDQHLPPDLSLDRSHFVNFMKRLRERLGYEVRYYMCGEYGEIHSRPHYHACLFGLQLPDRVYWSKSDRGDTLYRSAFLDDVWQQGAVFAGEVTFESACYVARYVMKKQIGEDVPPKRLILDVTTGELVEREHEYSTRSMRPGLAKRWFEKYWRDVYPEGLVTLHGGTKVKAPKYYDKLYKELDPKGYERLVARRLKEADGHFEDAAPRRLRAHDAVMKARTRSLLRKKGG